MTNSVGFLVAAWPFRISGCDSLPMKKRNVYGHAGLTCLLGHLQNTKESIENERNTRACQTCIKYYGAKGLNDV